MSFRNLLRLLLKPAAVLPLAALLTLGCGLLGSEGGQPEPGTTPAITPTPPPAATASPPTPTPVAPAVGARLPVTWTRTDLPTLQAEERVRPYEDVMGEGSTDTWSAYLVEGDSEPRLLHETHRRLYGIRWMDESLLLSFHTRYQDSNQGGGGLQVLDGATGEQRMVTQPPPGYPMYASPTGEYTLTHSATTGAVDEGSIYLTDGQGQTWRLEDDTFRLVLGWTPDGRYLLAARPHPFEPNWDSMLNYAIEPLGEEAIFLGVGAQPTLDPDGERFATVHRNEVTIYDIERSTAMVVDTGPSRPDWNIPAKWSADGRYLAVRDGAIEVASGHVLIQPTDRRVIASGVSPDGRWLAVTLDPIPGTPGEGRLCEEDGIANQTLLIDLASGEEHTLLECNHGFYASFDWLDERRIITYSHSCWGCGGGGSRLSLVTLDETGHDALVQPLSESFLRSAAYDLSPEGRLLLLTGSELRLFDLDGDLVRSIPVPHGARVVDVAWNQDGSRFVYIVGPLVVRLL